MSRRWHIAVLTSLLSLSCSGDATKSSPQPSGEKATPTEIVTDPAPADAAMAAQRPAPDAAPPAPAGPIIGTPRQGRPSLRGPMPNGGLRSFQRTVAAQLSSNPQHYLVERVTDDKVIALTFDDGPDPKLTPKLLAALATANAKATFFLVGHRMESHPKLVADIRAAGHTVAGHGYRHNDHREVATDKAVASILRTDDVVAKHFGDHAGYWRPPYGAVTDDQLAALRARDFRTVLWSVDSLDWSTPHARRDRIETRVLSQAHPGAIVLLHSGARRTATAAALPRILRELSARGYRFVTIEQLFALPRSKAAAPG